MHNNIELIGQCIKLFGHINIGFRWRGIVAGVIVYEMSAEALYSSARLVTSRG